MIPSISSYCLRRCLIWFLNTYDPGSIETADRQRERTVSSNAGNLCGEDRQRTGEDATLYRVQYKDSVSETLYSVQNTAAAAKVKLDMV